ncbi:hypothetical protein LZZ85_10565 [Terrimonas sp. NA20]|uniref:Uncharacterized protein n=1 Tax=Terrimonas ginsenosidimutans TaxID=2908004 RepID=A0ABS9KQW5_9BACT|nr:hypothetical protein [Terrimonas ginsenosidimutans]MCG2614727.1 hypothetical protein [Terrimonas ginsenosidimutans]
MIIYQRDIRTRLLSLQFTFFILAAICFWAFKFQYDTVGWLVVVIFITLSIVVTRDFRVKTDSFSISKYYFFGLVKITWSFRRGEAINAFSFDPDFGQDGEAPSLEDPNMELGCLYLVFVTLSPPKIAKREFKIEKLNELGQRSQSVNMCLFKTEFNHLQTFLRQE